jgi:hypothetical protein
MARTIHPEGTASQRDAGTSHGSWEGESGRMATAFVHDAPRMRPHGSDHPP